MAKDPYKYFRVEAQELLEGLTQGVLRPGGLEEGGAPPTRLLRCAHTLKGAARVVRQPRIAELAHQVEELLGQSGPSAPRIAALLQCFDAIARELNAIGAPPKEAAPTRTARPTTEEPFETVRIDLQDLDGLLRDVTEAGVQVGALRRSLAEIAEIRELATRLRDRMGQQAGGGVELTRGLAEEMRSSAERLERTFSGEIERVERELAGARDATMRLRLLPARTIFPSLTRAVHDAAESLHQKAILETSGGEIRLDASVLAALRDALLHVVRNAVAHGLEGESDRLAAGKHGTGRVRLEVERQGSRIIFRCSDDGRGVDVEALRARAVQRNLVTAEDAAKLAPKEVLPFAFSSGLSTRREVTELAGRGVGLDVAREVATRLRGEVSLSSEPRQGTTIEMRVPVSLASFTALIVEAGGAAIAIPMEAVRSTLRLPDGEVARSGDRESILSDDEVIDFRSLHSLLRRVRSPGRSSVWSVVIVKDGARLAAIGVDRIVGASGVIMRSAPGVVEMDPIVAGISLDAEGNPRLVLDATSLVSCVQAGGDPAGEAPPTDRPPILVVDDSLTTRMLEKSILESAGYEVDLAVSAEEALGLARQRAYGLFIVDVEMPGMDGFTFVATTRADPEHRKVPAILVTSLSSPEDKQRGLTAGASAYVVKSEFDQGQLLQIIRTLIG